MLTFPTFRFVCFNKAAAGAVDQEFVHIFVCFFLPKTGSQRAGRGLKRFLEAVGFILAEFELKPSHGDPILGRNEMEYMG